MEHQVQPAVPATWDSPSCVLLVEDDPNDALLVQEALRRASRLGSVTLHHVTRLHDAIAWLETGTPQVILLDLSLPDSQSLDTVRRMVARARTAPVVALTGRCDERLSLDALREGADDFLPKGEITPALLGRTVLHAWERFQLSRVRFEARLHSQAEQLMAANAKLKRAQKSTLSLMQDLAREKERAESAAADLRTSRQALLSSEKRLGRIVDVSPVAKIFEDGESRKFLTVSRAFTKLFGYGMEQMPARGEWLRGAIPDPETRKRLSAFWQRRTAPDADWWSPETCEVEARTADGAARWVRFSISCIEGVNVVACVDLTDRKEMEEQLRAARRQADAAHRAKSIFLASMSHEIRTPMNAILGFSQLLARTSELDGEQRQHLDSIQRSGHHLLALIDDVLAMSKIEAGKMEVTRAEIRLPELLRQVTDMVRPQCRHLDLSTELSPELPKRVRTDGPKLRQILLNLLSNAAKFTSEGRVSLSARILDTESDSAHTPESTTLEITVADTGPGIGSADLDLIFEPFSQSEAGRRTEGGTGLGLAISRDFARRLGGELTALSRPGKGSEFTLVLPVEVVEPPAVDGEGMDASRVTACPRLPLRGPLAALPARLQRSLRDSVTQGDPDAVTAALDAIGEQDPQLADALRTLADDYRYDQLLDLLPAARPHADATANAEEVAS